MGRGFRQQAVADRTRNTRQGEIQIRGAQQDEIQIIEQGGEGGPRFGAVASFAQTEVDENSRGVRRSDQNAVANEERVEASDNNRG